MSADEETEVDSASTALSKSGRYAKLAGERLSERFWNWYEGLSKSKAVVIGSFATVIFSRVGERFLILVWKWINEGLFDVGFGGSIFPSEYPLPLSTVEMIWVLFILVGLNAMGSMSSANELQIRELQDRVDQLEKELEDKDEE